MHDELISEFVAGSLEHIRDVEPLLLEMEESGLPTMDQMNQIFRAVHSIKGAAGFLGLGNIQRMSHSGENLLMLLRDGNLEFDPSMADPLLESVDALRCMLEQLPEDIDEFPEALLATIEAIAAGETAEAGGDTPEPTAEPGSTNEQVLDEGTESSEFRRTRFGEIAVDLKFLDESQLNELLAIQAEHEAAPPRLRDLVVELEKMSTEQVDEVLGEQVIRRAMAQQREAIQQMKEAPPMALAKTGPQEGEPPAAGAKKDKNKSAKAKSESRNETIRVNVGLLDELMNLAGELVLGRNQLVQTLEEVEVPGLKRVLQGIDLVTSDLQEHIMHTRMQPLSVVFDRLPRMVRDISKKVNKDVGLDIYGKDVELDRSILEALGDPMTHLIRNSMDHGLEEGQDREAAGKPAKGQVTVRAYHQGGQIIVEIEDDGRGIDPAKLRQVSIDRGLYTEDEAASLTDKEAIYLIFNAGLSTAQEVTAISGRGVGMDVVRSNIESLGGQIDLESTVGVGTVVRIRLPLTLAIITSLTVSVGDERYVLPQVNLQEILRMKPEELDQKVETLLDVEVLRMRNQLLPLIRLSNALGIPPTENPTSTSVVVLRSGEREYGLVVDGVHDNEEIVVKPLSGFLNDCKWFAGATILGDGTVAMILDAMGLADYAKFTLDDFQNALTSHNHQVDETDSTNTRALILFGNGEQEQFALPLREVRRLERIRTDQIEYVGHNEFIQHRGHSIPLLRLENLLPVSSAMQDGDSLFIIIPNTEHDEVGIVATRIIDTVTSDASPEPGQIRQAGLLGSSILHDQMTLFLNTQELLETSGLVNFA